MALSTKGWRRIVVEGRLFFWQSIEWGLFHARPEVDSYRHLVVTRSQCASQSGGFFRGATPGIVQVCIEAAIKAGWIENRPSLQQVALNPRRCVAVDPRWVTPTVVALVEGIRRERAFDRLPILADALQDAGCDSADILSHCREPGEHTEGCWVVALLTTEVLSNAQRARTS